MFFMANEKESEMTYHLFFGDDKANSTVQIATFDWLIEALNCGATISRHSTEHVYVRDADGEFTHYFDRALGDWRDAYNAELAPWSGSCCEYHATSGATGDVCEDH